VAASLLAITVGIFVVGGYVIYKLLEPLTTEQSMPELIPPPLRQPNPNPEINKEKPKVPLKEDPNDCDDDDDCEKYRDFAHGSSLESINNIVTNGFSIEPAIVVFDKLGTFV
jgi:hypothetical protein